MEYLMSTSAMTLLTLPSPQRARWPAENILSGHRWKPHLKCNVFDVIYIKLPCLNVLYASWDCNKVNFPPLVGEL
jgi:hypothetical protein